MTYTPTDWNEGVAPGISAAELDRIEAGIDFVHPLIVSDSDYVTGSTGLGARALILDVVLPIPSKWNTWDCMFFANWVWRSGSTFSISTAIAELEVNGTEARQTDWSTAEPWTGLRIPSSLSGRVSGLAVTGNIDVELFMTLGTGVVQAEYKSLLAMGVRTS